MKDTESLVNRAIAIRCREQQPTIVHLTPYTGKKYSSSMMYIQISYCIINVQSCLTACSIGKTRIFNLMFASLLSDTIPDSLTSLYDHVEPVVSLGYINGGHGNATALQLFRENWIYPNIAEIILRDALLTTLPNFMETMFPNLQSLEIAGNKLTELPESFPWTDNSKELPDNLSRTDFMQNQYATSEFLDVPTNLFRRTYVLDNNMITSVANLFFHGDLQKITMRSNGLTYLHSDTFANVTGLQYLDLSANELTYLSLGLFRTLFMLKRMDLSENNLTYINSSDFDFNNELVYLSIANNSLETLEAGAFVKLKKLEVLHLENNLFHFLHSDAFPVDSLNFKELYLDHNPLFTLPTFIFWFRWLNLASLRHTLIRFENFTDFVIKLQNDRTQIAHSVIDSASDSDISDLMKQSINPPLVDLSHSRISHLSLEESYDSDYEFFIIVFLHFKFDLTGNPIVCDCNISNINKYLSAFEQNGSISNLHSVLRTWTCAEPVELKGTVIVDVKEEQTYCAVALDNCPHKCSCYQKSISGHIIVDCRWDNLSLVHNTLPAGDLELWYSHNNISDILENPSFSRVVSLDLSFNKLESIDGRLFQQMSNLRFLNLTSNHLTYLPDSIARLRLKSVSLSSNYFKCDCKSLWMKTWLKRSVNVIKDWTSLTCTTSDGTSHVFVEVDDNQFVCKDKDPEFDELGRVIVPSVVSATIVVFLVCVCIAVYTFRLEIKVILFVYFGIHPFDDNDKFENENIDCVIVHSSLQTDWVMERLVGLLESSNYNFIVCDMARDFVVGYSFQENLRKTVHCSKRMIFLISQDWNPVAESFGIAWGMAQDKIREARSNYGIIVTHKMKRHEINDKDIQMFIKRGRYIDSSEKLFENKVLYYMPQQKKTPDAMAEFYSSRYRLTDVSVKYYVNQVETGEIEQTDDDITSTTLCENSKFGVFISYGETDLNYAMNTLVPIIEENGLNYCLPDKDFVVGASKEGNILNAVQSSCKTIFIVSPTHVSDEWSLFTFRTAYEKSLREKTNHLIVIIKDETDTENDIQDEEMRHYLKNYICLQQNDRWFKKKLINSLMVVQEQTLTTDIRPNNPQSITIDE